MRNIDELGERYVVKKMDYPPMNKIKNRVGVIFENETPEVDYVV